MKSPLMMGHDLVPSALPKISNGSDGKFAAINSFISASVKPSLYLVLKCLTIDSMDCFLAITGVYNIKSV